MFVNKQFVPGSEKPSFVCRVIDTYIEEDIWYLPLEASEEAPPEQEETYDVSVYNPRAWTTDSVPGQLIVSTVCSVQFIRINYKYILILKKN
jgi:hypothetical protein